MNQHDQMRQALAILQHFRKHVDMEENTYNELVETCDNMEQALAAELAPTVEPSEVAKRTLANPPERIYLQVGDVDAEFPGEIHWRDVT